MPKRVKLDGMDLSEIILKERDAIIRTMVWNGTTIRRGRWKYMALQKGLSVESLFDLTAEIGESTNLIAQYPRIAQSFRNELELWKNDMDKTKTPQPTQPK